MKKFKLKKLLIILLIIISLIITSFIVSIFLPKKNPPLEHRYLPSFLPSNVLPNVTKKFPNSTTYTCSNGDHFGIIQSDKYPKKRICEYEISKCHEYTAREYYEVHKNGFIGNHARLFYTNAQGNEGYIVENYEDNKMDLSYEAYFQINDSVVQINTSGQCLGVNEITSKIERENKAVEILTNVANSLYLDSK